MVTVHRSSPAPKGIAVLQRPSRFHLALPILLLVASTATASPGRIGNFSTLRDVLAKGASVRAVVDYSRCNIVEAGDGRLRPPLSGGFTVDDWRCIVDTTAGQESLSVIVSGENLVAGPRGGMLLLQVELEVFHDERVTVVLRHLDPDSGEVVSRWTLSTTLDRGDDGAAALFRLR